MADISQLVNTNFVVSDLATKALRGIAGAAQTVSHQFDHASSIVGAFGGLAAAAAGAFGAHEILEGSMEYVGQVKRISEFTGMAAERADGMLEAMGKLGIAGSDAERMLVRLSLRGAKVEEQMQGAAIVTKGLGQRLSEMGVDITRGPGAAIEQMQRATKGSVDRAQQFAAVMGMRPEMAESFVRMLKQNPAKFREEIDKIAKSTTAVHARDVEALGRIKILRAEMSQAWERIKVVIGTRLFPVIEHLLKYTLSNLDGWVERAAKFGEVLGGFLEKHHHEIILIGKLMLANFSLMKMTGSGIGGWVGKLLPVIGKMAGITAVGAAGHGAAAGAHGSGGMLRGVVDLLKVGVAKAGGGFMAVMRLAASPFKALAGQFAPLMRMFGPLRGLSLGFRGFAGMFSPARLMTMMKGFGPALWNSLKGGWAALKGGFSTIIGGLAQLRPILATIGKLTLVGIVIGFVIGLVMKAVELIQGNVDGIRTYLMETWETMRARVAVISDLLKPIFHAFSGEGAVGKFFHEFAFVLIVALADATDGILQTLQTIILIIQKMGTDFASVMMHPIETFKQQWAVAAEMTAKKQQQLGVEAVNDSIEAAKRRREEESKGVSGMGRGTNFNFHNAKFDIKQTFPEGFDPDRMAVAFTNDLAKLGERRVQSGLTPLFAVR